MVGSSRWEVFLFQEVFEVTFHDEGKGKPIVAGEHFLVMCPAKSRLVGLDPNGRIHHGVP